MRHPSLLTAKDSRAAWQERLPNGKLLLIFVLVGDASPADCWSDKSRCCVKVQTLKKIAKKRCLACVLGALNDKHSARIRHGKIEQVLRDKVTKAPRQEAANRQDM